MLIGMFDGLNQLNPSAYPARLYTNGTYIEELFYNLDNDGNKEVSKEELKAFLHRMVNMAAKEIKAKEGQK